MYFLLKMGIFQPANVTLPEATFLGSRSTYPLFSLAHDLNRRSPDMDGSFPGREYFVPWMSWVMRFFVTKSHDMEHDFLALEERKSSMFKKNNSSSRTSTQTKKKQHWGLCFSQQPLVLALFNSHILCRARCRLDELIRWVRVRKGALLMLLRNWGGLW